MTALRVLSVVGARPQFIKAALLSRAFAAHGVTELLVHTGQHYDEAMSAAFFAELALPQPHAALGVGSGTHAQQTAEMLVRLERVLLDADPDCVLVYGDTNSTLAGALAAVKLGIPLVHVEAGLRSFDRRMPEEVNRLVADHLADLLFAPTESAAEQLRREGTDRPIAVVGDLMVDLALAVARDLPARPAVLDRFSLRSRAYVVATIHRASNTAQTARFAQLIAGLRQIGLPVIFPVHPRTRPLVEALRVGVDDEITVCEPLPYAEMIALQQHARAVVTDSGGMQKEAIVLGTPCVTLRDETEWTQTLEGGWNVLVGSDPAAIARAARRAPPVARIMPYGDGTSAARIVAAMLAHLTPRAADSCAS